jgi:hypothetical protein
MVNNNKPLLVGFAGVPGSGKTTLARLCAGNARDKLGISRVELVDEYARRYINKYGIKDIHDQMRLFNKQLEKEVSFFSTADLIWTDSPVFLGFMYALGMRTGTAHDVLFVNDLFKSMSKLNAGGSWYDIVFHVPPVLKPVDDGTRLKEQLTDEWRAKADLEIQAVFKLIFPPRKFVTIDIKTPLGHNDPNGLREWVNQERMKFVMTTVDQYLEEQKSAQQKS